MLPPSSPQRVNVNLIIVYQFALNVGGGYCKGTDKPVPTREPSYVTSHSYQGIKNNSFISGFARFKKKPGFLIVITLTKSRSDSIIGKSTKPL